MHRFRVLRIACFLPVLFLVTIAASEIDSHVMPQPATVNWQDGRLPIDGSFHIGVVGYDEPLLQSAARRFIDQLAIRTGIPLLDSISHDAGATLVFQCADAGERVQSLHADESYDLQISSKQALIKAASPIGILRGLA